MHVPSLPVGRRCQCPRRRLCPKDAGYSLPGVLVTLAVVAGIGCAAVLSGRLLRERFCDATVRLEVLRVAKAIEKLDPGTPPFAQSVCGPAVPHLPGVSLSRETTLFVQYRSMDAGPYYVIRGSHPSSRSAFIYAGGRLYETGAPASSRATWMHWVRDLRTLVDARK